MAQSGNGLTLFHNLATHRAHLVAGVAVFCTGGPFGILDLRRAMAQRRSEVIVILVAADRADVFVIAGSSAGGFCNAMHLLSPNLNFKWITIII